MNKVFLGGTCNESTWRDYIIPQLKVGYFNPVVEDWTPECQAEEDRQKEICNIHLYVLTPLMTGVYSVAEIIESAHNKNVTTIVCVLNVDRQPKGTYEIFDEGQRRSLKAVCNLAARHGAVICDTLSQVVKTINEYE